MPDPISAVLLAGGQSTRMGRDKALLPLSDGRLLWQRQIEVLRALDPVEVFISGPSRPGFPADVALLADQVPGRGPIAGVAAALRAMRTPLLVVLAVDLPAMTSDYLRILIAGSAPGRGIVPQGAAGFFQPLAATYPVDALPAAESSMRGPDHSMHGFVRALLEEGLVSARPISPVELPLFANWNSPPPS